MQDGHETRRAARADGACASRLQPEPCLARARRAAVEVGSGAPAISGEVPCAVASQRRRRPGRLSLGATSARRGQRESERGTGQGEPASRLACVPAGPGFVCRDDGGPRSTQPRSGVGGGGDLDPAAPGGWVSGWVGGRRAWPATSGALARFRARKGGLPRTKDQNRGCLRIAWGGRVASGRGATPCRASAEAGDPV